MGDSTQVIFCIECTFWSLVQSHPRAPYGFGACLSEHWKPGYGADCLPSANQSDVVIESDEGWMCFTGPKFGCVHGRRKEPLPFSFVYSVRSTITTALPLHRADKPGFLLA